MKVSKYFIFLVKSFLGSFNCFFGDFLLVTLHGSNETRDPLGVVPVFSVIKAVAVRRSSDQEFESRSCRIFGLHLSRSLEQDSCCGTDGQRKVTFESRG